LWGLNPDKPPGISVSYRKVFTTDGLEAREFGGGKTLRSFAGWV
jgi:hypothetical protein